MSIWHLVVLFFAVLIYFIPGIIAANRDHPNTGAIWALNLLLGWTVLGWIGSLVWALTYNKATPIADTKQCAYCAETIKAEASICRFCSREQSVKEEGITSAQIDAINASLGTRYSKADMK